MNQKAKRVLSTGMVFTLLLSSTFIGDSGIEAKSGQKTKIEITNPHISSIYLKKGESFKLKASGKKLKYTTSNKKIATVSKKGKIQAVKVGTAKVTISSKEKTTRKATLKVIVLKKLKKISKVVLNQTQATLNVGGPKLKLQATVKPKNATKKSVVYKSMNQSVATVTKKGVVAPKSVGNTIIYAYAADGRGAFAKCTICVKAKDVIPPVASVSPTPTAVTTTAPTQVPTSSPALSTETPVPARTEAPIVTMSPTEVTEKVNFTSESNYRSYAVVTCALPDGVTGSDVTEIEMGVDSDKDMTMRLYAGDTMSDASEMTSEKRVLSDKVTGTSSETIDGASVTKTAHKLSITSVSSTRFDIKNATYRKHALALDDKAKSALQSQNKNELKLCIYPHSVNPNISFYNITLKTATGSYKVTLNAENVIAKEGGKITFSL